MSNVHPDGCDDCGLVAPLYHNEAVGASLCEDCDRKADEANAHIVARREASAAHLAVKRAEAELEALRAEANRLEAVANRAELWAEAKSLRMRAEYAEACAARITLANPEGKP